MIPYTRREFTKLALAALPAAGALSILPSLGAAEKPAKPSGKPNSKFAGTCIGLNVPYSFSNPGRSGDEVLANCVQVVVSGVELRAQPVSSFQGALSGLI